MASGVLDAAGLAASATGLAALAAGVASSVAAGVAEGVAMGAAVAAGVLAGVVPAHARRKRITSAFLEGFSRYRMVVGLHHQAVLQCIPA